MVKECDERNSHISSKLHLFYISSNNDRQPVTKTFTPLHYNCRHFTSCHSNFTQLHFTTLHYPLIWLYPTEISYRSISPRITTFHLTSLHSTNRRFSPHVYSLHFTPFIITFPTFFLKLLGLQGNISICVFEEVQNV
jgi:hypothetical protein